MKNYFNVKNARRYYAKIVNVTMIVSPRSSSQTLSLDSGE